MDLPSNFDPNSTVAACATPPGEGGIAIIRLSGSSAFQIADKVFSKNVLSMPSHTVHYGNLISPVDGSTIDTILLLKMQSPNSFTGEDIVEFHCHGGTLITEKALSIILSSGAKAALPGEFSKRAFLNGKVDLSQAEAIQELIGAKNDYALKAAQNHLQGSLSKKISSFTSDLTTLAAILEAWIDFPEEDLEFTSKSKFIEDLKCSIDKIKNLSATFQDGKKITEGIHVCFLGIPNAGKSSLMNILLDKDRAIVTDIPGTTRDLLEDSIRMQGLHIRLTDTAGIRPTDSIIEKEGIRRSWDASSESDLLLLVLDASEGQSAAQLELIKKAPPEKSIVIWNKIDLPHAPLPSLEIDSVEVSALNQEGIPSLKNLIHKKIWKRGAPSQEEILITSLRHKEALDLAVHHLTIVIIGLSEERSPEFIAFDMKSALHALGSVIGADITENLLDSIFSQFCLGK